jgi:hypothetical protein
VAKPRYYWTEALLKRVIKAEASDCGRKLIEKRLRREAKSIAWLGGSTLNECIKKAWVKLPRLF